MQLLRRRLQVRTLERSRGDRRRRLRARLRRRLWVAERTRRLAHPGVRFVSRLVDLPRIVGIPLRRRRLVRCLKIRGVEPRLGRIVRHPLHVRHLASRTRAQAGTPAHTAMQIPSHPQPSFAPPLHPAQHPLHPLLQTSSTRTNRPSPRPTAPPAR